MLSKQDIDSFIESGESEWLDFKEKYYEEGKNLDLLHDVLCMANARHNGDRYIVFGVSDVKEVVGTEKPRHKQSGIVDFLSSSNINRSIYNNIKFEHVSYDDKHVWVLIIPNRPDKPFFILKPSEKDKNAGNDKGIKNKKDKYVRPEVIYTRHGDKNTAIDATASDDEIELMWRERFALDQPPLKRFLVYLEVEKWMKASDGSYYCEQYPEFRIKKINDSCIDSKVPENDQWMPGHWALTGREILVEDYSLNYFEMRLEETKIKIWWCDNMIIPVPLPSQPERKSDQSWTWKLSRQSLQYKVGKIVAEKHNQDLEEILKQTKIDVLD